MIRIRRDTVDVWLENRCCGVFDRISFRQWMSLPRDWIGSGDVLFVGSPGFVGLAIRDVMPVGAVSSQVLLALRGLV